MALCQACRTLRGREFRVPVRGTTLVVVLCQVHQHLAEDVMEEVALRREQRREQLRWGDPARMVGGQ